VRASQLKFSLWFMLCVVIRAKQGVALTGRNRTGPPRSVSRPTAHAPCGRHARPPAALQTTTDDGDKRRRQTTNKQQNRHQRAKQYWPMALSGPVIKCKETHVARTKRKKAWSSFYCNIEQHEHNLLIQQYFISHGNAFTVHRVRKRH